MDRAGCYESTYHLRNNSDVGAESVEVDLVGWQPIVTDNALGQDAAKKSQCERALSTTGATNCMRARA